MFVHSCLHLASTCGTFDLESVQQGVTIDRTIINGSEVVSINEPGGGDYSCTSNSISCNMTITGNCNSAICLNSRFHCPTTSDCQICDIECGSNRICKNSTIYSYECQNTRVWASGSLTDVLRGMQHILCLHIFFSQTNDIQQELEQIQIKFELPIHVQYIYC